MRTAALYMGHVMSSFLFAVWMDMYAAGLFWLVCGLTVYLWREE